jgi:hypothetical protein
VGESEEIATDPTGIREYNPDHGIGCNGGINRVASRRHDFECGRRGEPVR